MGFRSKDSEFGFAMFVVWVCYAFFSIFCVASEREQDQTFMSDRRIGDLRNDFGLSPGGIVRHVDLEIGSFADDISLYFAFVVAAAAVEAANTVVSLFQVKAPFFGFGFFCSMLLFFFFGDVGFGCGFPVHSFGLFVWLLVVLMVVESGFVAGGGDETGFGYGFHVLHVVTWVRE